MSNFYTGTGDDGISRVGRKKIKKNRIECSALGDLDELVSLLGVIKNQKNNRDFYSLLEAIQEDIFIIQAHVGACWFEKEYRPPAFLPHKTKKLEQHIKRFESILPPLRKFVIPGANEASAWFDVARAVARRAERSVLAHNEAYSLNPSIIVYLNRLSSLLFVMGRVAAQSNKEINPHY